MDNALPQKNILKKPTTYYAVMGFIILFPFYFWQSGLPQISDIFFAGCLLLIGPGLFIRSQKIKPETFFLFGFALYAMIVNLIHFMFIPDHRFLLSSTFYIYNGFVFIFARHAFAHKSVEPDKVLLPILSGLLILEILWITLSSFDGARAIGTFNNPNQLAFWDLIVLAMIFILVPKELKTTHIVIMALCGFIAVITLSRNGLVNTAALIIISLLYHKKSDTVKNILVFMGPLVIVAFLIIATILFGEFFSKYYELFVKRFTLFDGFIESVFIQRGWGRVVDEPHWNIIGAGEGGYARFPFGHHPSSELHSGIGTLIFSYGILGFSIFSGFIIRLLRRANLPEIIIIVLMIVFNVTHQAIRFSMFWVLLALIAALQDRRVRAKREEQLRQEDNAESLKTGQITSIET